MPATSTPLDHERYINLETFKKDGNGVKTPVWAAPLDGKLVVFSESKAFKVKRLRRDPRFRAAGCDMRGKVHGEWYSGTGRIVEEPAQIARMLGALGEKYGWQMAIGNFLARLTGRFNRRAYIELTFE
jgi:PPOX class probable F420-dependent enzyme